MKRVKDSDAEGAWFKESYQKVISLSKIFWKFQ